MKARPRIPPEKDRRDRGPPPEQRATCARRKCCFNCCVWAVTKTMSVALLLTNNSKRSPAFAAQLHLPTHDIFWANLKVQLHLPPLKPVLNWANICSPNILRTLRQTMIRFLIELFVRRIWFGQSKLYFILNWLVIRCKLRPELTADALQTA